MTKYVRYAAAFAALAALAIGVLGYPFARIVLALGLFIYALILHYHPTVWLIAVPAALPVFDLAPWSGRYFFDELDFVVLLTLVVGLLRCDDTEIEVRSLSRPAMFGLALLVVSYGISLVIGLWPLDPLDANAFANYYSRYNSLRMSKGFFAAVALFFLFQRQRASDDLAARQLISGMVLGVAGTGVAVVLERFRFSGLWDFTSDFRVTGTFSGLHNGGNDLEAYLVMAQPFIVASMILYRHWLSVIGGIGLFALSTYSLIVTFSRAGLLAMIVSGVCLTLGLAVSVRRKRAFSKLRLLSVGGVLVSIVVALAAYAVGGGYFRDRFNRVKQDWGYRMLQSRKTVAMMDPDGITQWFGMGVGRYPATVYQRNPLNNRPAAYRLETERENIFLRLYPGNWLYFGQRISGIRPFERHQFTIDARAQGRGTLSVYICEKTLQYSFRCANKSFAVAETNAWVTHKAEMNVGAVGANDRIGGWLLRRPVEFALANSSKNVVIDVDNVRLLDSNGNNLLVNGSFSKGADRWYFTVDDHVPWQNWNHWVHLYFEQGRLGVISFLLFTVCLLGRLTGQIVQGNWLAAIALAAVSSFLTVGIFGYLFDTPRMALIYFLIALIFGRGLSVENGPERFSAQA